MPASCIRPNDLSIGQFNLLHNHRQHSSIGHKFYVAEHAARKAAGEMGCCWFSPCICPITKDLHLAKSCKLSKYDKFIIRCDATNLAYPVRVKDCILIRTNYRTRQSASQASGACFVMGQAADATTTIRTSGRLDVPEFLANPALVWESVHQAGEPPRGSLVTTDACQVPLGAAIDLGMGFFKTRLDHCIRPTIQQGVSPAAWRADIRSRVSSVRP
jgi:hypothetical protein